MSTLQGALLSFYVIADAVTYDENTDSWSAYGDHAYYFHNGTSESGGNVVWQGQEYTKFPIQVEGFEASGNGKMPRPVFRLSNLPPTVGQYISAISQAHNDLVGWCVLRKRTFAMFLDAVNFTNGNPNANATEEFPIDVYYVDRKLEDNKLTIAWELAAASDLQGVQIPRGQIVANYCNALYNYAGHPSGSSKCTYAGALATCTRLLDGTNGCVDHFPANAELPFAGFPGCGLRRA